MRDFPDGACSHDDEEVVGFAVVDEEVCDFVEVVDVYGEDASLLESLDEVVCGDCSAVCFGVSYEVDVRDDDGVCL